MFTSIGYVLLLLVFCRFFLKKGGENLCLYDILLSLILCNFKATSLAGSSPLTFGVSTVMKVGIRTLSYLYQPVDESVDNLGLGTH